MEDFSDYLRLRNNCDQGDPLLSSTRLGEALAKICLTQVDKSDLLELTQALNLKQLIPTAAGHPRDFRGLAELMGFSTIEIETQIKLSHNPTGSLIDRFIIKNLNYEGQSSLSVNDLLKFIERIERFDVIDDFLPTLIKLASSNCIYNQLAPRNAQETIKYAESQASNYDRTTVAEMDRLTIVDTPYYTVNYDAFISFSPEDHLHAQEIIDLLEGAGKSIVTASDVLPGHFEHDALIRLIERCKRVVVILTPSYARSKECAFQANVASEASIKTGTPLIIPVLCEPCDEASIPNKIKMLSKIDLTNPKSRQWQLTKLVPTIGQSSDSSMIEAKYRQRGVLAQETSRSLNPATNETASRGNCEPIVDFPHSQSSNAINQACNMLTFIETEPTTRISPPTSNSSNPLNRFKKWVLRNSTNNVTDSTSSQAMLIASVHTSEEKIESSDNDV